VGKSGNNQRPIYDSDANGLMALDSEFWSQRVAAVTLLSSPGLSLGSLGSCGCRGHRVRLE
jgi:hypothetical protein